MGESHFGYDPLLLITSFIPAEPLFQLFLIPFSIDRPPQA
jgi:hypothetical protein